MKPLTLLLVLITIVSCQTHVSGPVNPVDELSETQVQENYQKLLDRIHTKTKTIQAEKLPAYLENCLTDSMFNFWYNTPWDFNGTTEQPRKGKIACGYFVTTTLKHLGLNIDRVYLAQQASSVLIKEVCDANSIKVFTNSKVKQMLDYVKKYKGNVFIIGLDNHTGFIVREGEELFFVHASGLYPQKVVKDSAVTSNQLNWSKYHMVGHLNFTNWVKGLQKPE